jgi:hypothetical protein
MLTSADTSRSRSYRYRTTNNPPEYISLLIFICLFPKSKNQQKIANKHQLTSIHKRQQYQGYSSLGAIANGPFICFLVQQLRHVWLLFYAFCTISSKLFSSFITFFSLCGCSKNPKYTSKAIVSCESKCCDLDGVLVSLITSIVILEVGV